MYFDPSEEFSGVTMRELRRVFRLLNCGDRSVFIGWFCDRLKLDPGQGLIVLEALIARGFVQKYQGQIEPNHTSLHEMTDAGSSLANAHFTKRFSRVTAARILEAVQTRAAAVNADAALLVYVEEIKVFGSWLSEKQDLGDLDLAIELNRRYFGKDYTRLNLLLAESDGFRGSFPRQLCYADTLAYRRVKGRDGRISIHSLDEIKTLGTDTQSIFMAGAIARQDAALLIAAMEAKLSEFNAI